MMGGVGVTESWLQARGLVGVRIQQDEAFLIKRKYLCLCAMAVGTQDNPENSLFKVQILKANTHF